MAIWLRADSNSFQRRPICVLLFREVSCVVLMCCSHTVASFRYLLLWLQSSFLYQITCSLCAGFHHFYPSLNAFPQSANAPVFLQCCSITCGKHRHPVLVSALYSFRFSLHRESAFPVQFFRFRAC